MSEIRRTVTIQGNQLHVAQESDNDWEVWLDTDAGEFDGLCIGIGESAEAAMENAKVVLKDCVYALERDNR